MVCSISAVYEVPSAGGFDNQVDIMVTFAFYNFRFY